ncbi:hypothetical protein BJ742DRAFT_805824 [Cladochytrium replicatum]|nr:hypothetical protein BJ742DRAFT_805824 [Cladochytrium replicatum]
MTADTKDNKDAVEVKVTEEVELAAASSSAAAAAKHDKDEEVHVEVTEELDPELEKLLQTEPLQGLSDAEVNERLAQFGHNEIPEKKTNPFLKFLSYFIGSIAFLLEVATIMSAVVGKWPEFGILVFVLILNAIIGFVEEARAESALDALKNTLALKTRVWRNGQLIEVDSSTLVPGDVIALRLGDIVPADCRLLGIGVTGEETEGALQIDQSALTGESLPVSKKKGSIAFSSSIVKQGQMLAVVTKTGIHTYIGRAANLISITNERGHFQKVIGAIGNFLVIIVLIMVIILMFVLIFARGYGPLEAIVKVLVLTVAAIPVGLPTVLSVTMALGSNQLAKKQVIVKRLTAIEELASVSILCSDKTGTLTLNELTFDNPYLSNKGNTSTDFYGTGVPYTNEDLLLTAYFASEPGAQDAIELAVRTAAEERVEVLRTREGSGHQIPGYKVNGFIPFNPTSKYTEATVTDHATGKQFRCIKGAPQVIVRMVGGHDEASDAVLNFARRGLRALGVARTIDAEMTKFELVGMISLLDPPRPDSAATIKDCEAYGVRVKMITGDQLIIAKEVAYRLNMNRTILDAGTLADESLPVDVATDRCDKADGFAQVIPEHKYKVVELLQNRGYLVGMTGDGVNDAPALKKANVGIAVAGCTDAARSAADIVLLAHGLSTIVDGIKTSRAIFQRMRSYALYRIASTIHFMVFFFLTILIWEYSLSDSLILMITILNDAATLVISVDNARISKRPDKWRLGQLITLSFVLGIALTVISFAHFFVATYGLGYKITRALDCDHGISDTCDGFLNSFIYLNVSSCPHFVIFSTRLPTWLWKNIPHWIFTVVIIGTQVIAVIMSATGVFGIGFFGAGAIGWGPAILILLVSFVMTFFLDAIKVFVMRYWSFEMTAKLWPSPSRRRELARRKDRVIMLKRYKINIAKLRKVLAMANVIVAFKNAAKKKYISRGASAVEANVETIVATEAEPLVKN